MRIARGTALAVVVLVALHASACFFDTDGEPVEQDDTDTGDGGVGPDGGDDVGNVSGTVTIAEGLDDGSYAVGDLYLAFLAECPTGIQPVESYGVFVEEELDFTTPGATRVFAVNGAPAGVSYLSVFLDSNGDVEDPTAPEPDNPDAVSTTCAEVDLDPGATVADVAVTLDMTMPSF